MSLIMCIMTLALVGCVNKLEIENNDNNNGIESEVVSGSINGHEYVDLGLPSGTKWATCNVGANNPEEYGNYYAWGEIMAKSEYTEENCVTCGESMDDISGDTNYDVARTIWGESWRIPTKAELEELKNKCTWTWCSQDDVNGYKIIGPNGNSIFIPAAGYYDGASRIYVGKSGGYWSSTPYESNTSRAYDFGFYSGGRSMYWYYRYIGRTVRPVTE